MTMIPLHSRVALKPGADEIYTHAFVGSEGWVRAIKKDADGFEMVNVEWDKDHWRFNGQPDGWTFSDHFDVIGPPELPEAVKDMSDEELPEQHGAPNHTPSD